MSRIVHHRGPARVEANLTPMIDVTFLLIVFFVLVSRIVDVEHVDLELPRPDDPASAPLGDESRVVINIVPGASGTAEAYRLGSREFPPNEAGLEQLTARLAEALASSPSTQVNLRADQGTHYEWINPVIDAVPEAARASGRPNLTPRLNLVVVRERD